MAEEALQDAGAVTDASDSAEQSVPEMVEVGEAAVPQFHVLEVVPEILDRVELRGIAGEALEQESGGGAGAEELADAAAAVGGQAVPDDQQLARDLAEQVLEEPDSAGAGDRAGLDLQVDFARLGQRPDDREVVAGQPAAQDRRLAARGVGPDPAGEQAEAGLVDPDDGPPLGAGFASRAGQRSSRQAAMTASSRCVARKVGSCGVSPSRASSLLTCPRW